MPSNCPLFSELCGYLEGIGFDVDQFCRWAESTLNCSFPTVIQLCIAKSEHICPFLSDMNWLRSKFDLCSGIQMRQCGSRNHQRKIRLRGSPRKVFLLRISMLSSSFSVRKCGKAINPTDYYPWHRAKIPSTARALCSEYLWDCLKTDPVSRFCSAPELTT